MVSKICPALLIDPNHSCASIQVPTIVIFTKMDALEDRAFNELIEQHGLSFVDAKEKAPSVAAERFQEYYRSKLDRVKHHPSEIVQLRGTCKPVQTFWANNVYSFKLIFQTCRNRARFVTSSSSQPPGPSSQRF